METLKFLMVTTHYPPANIGGDAVVVKNLSEELRNRGHEVHVFCNPMVHDLIRGGDSGSLVGTEVTNLRIHEFRTSAPSLRIGASHVLGLWRKAERRLKEYAKETRPDIVHWHNTRAFIGRPFELSTSRNFYTAHDYSLICPKGNLLRHDSSLCDRPAFCQACLLLSRKYPQVWRAGSRRPILRADSSIHVLSPSAFMEDRLAREGTRNRSILRNFVPEPESRRSGHAAENQLVYLGILERHKGPQTLLRAFAESHDQQEFNLVIIGEGSLKKTLKQEIAERDLHDRISVKGFLQRQEVQKILSNSSALVVPSEWYENAPLTALEGLSMGLPLIVSDIGGLPEIAKGCSGVIRFESGNSSDLSDKLVTLWCNRGKLDDMSVQARNAYVAEYGPDSHIDRYLGLVRA